ncbi:MAG: TetR/AcrR family transcriptional regulator [Rhodospirillales bacterium]|nr:TetR/AcrR family transcriptional regulator [Rhodospirillales bacterium]
MAQVKKTSVRLAILEAAHELFMNKGYSATTLSDIASGSGVTMSNIYNYFRSKLDVLYALYEPWLDQRLDRLSKDVARIRDPRKRLRKVLLAVLRDIPMENNCFANNVLQALSTRTADDPYSRELLLRSEQKVSAMIRDALPDSARFVMTDNLLAHLLFMAFDGFAVNYKVNGPSRRVEGIVDMLVDLIMATAAYDAIVQEGGDPSANTA